ncbi:hypothetical protein [Salinicola avicenniae]|uniref:hypothetical protein n=1 Tax=Salinicola avicenniae TaxID=2916836 RepID=UPI002074AAF3|nr:MULTISPECIES: hypothetical protein [unclassified Salinicola]
MDQWLQQIQEAVLGVGLITLLLVYRRNPLSLLAIAAAASLCLATAGSALTPEATGTTASAALLFALLALASRQSPLPIWLASTLSPSPNGPEAAVQVTAHPVSGKLQVFYLSRWFDAVLIDPANPPLRDGETVYLIRHSARQAWVSRVRSHTPPPESPRRWHWHWHTR